MMAFTPDFARDPNELLEAQIAIRARQNAKLIPRCAAVHADLISRHGFFEHGKG